ncbi:MAG: hypothetical protein PHY93_21705 [Bacteriovorax sp.]|nr:hypothetical protein [Bacteriovorax sp.]
MKEETNFYEQSSTVTKSAPKKQLEDVPSIRLSPEQIEEINTDDYSLTLFNATRMQPLSLGEIKRQFVETEQKKAESVMERFLKIGLIHKTDDGKFYSNFPTNYINYADYRYDGDLEAKKDSKVFKLMKENTGKKEYWKDKSYFSIDAFFTEDQSKEIQEMLKEVKLKTKQFANENDKLGIKGMKFRRFKFYDMFWAFALIALTFSLTSLHPSSTAFAMNGGSGNDPVGMSSIISTSKLIELNKFGGSGNDPTASFMNIDITDNEGGGGHDPENNSTKCGVMIKNRIFNGFFNVDENSCVLLDEQIVE